MTSTGHDVAAVDASPGPFRALLVTGDAELQRVLTRILAEAGTAPCEVGHAATLVDATSAAAGCDVILLDMAVAGEPPLAAFATLRERCPDGALVAITAEPHGFFLVRDLLAAGAQDCLVRQCLLAQCAASESAARTAVWCAVQVRRAQRKLDFLAHHDALTGLANRTLLVELLRQALAGARRSREAVALLSLDLDGFKAVNDRLGHEAGDRVLQEVARRLVASLREADIVARLGGDEFVIVPEGPASRAHATKVQDKVARAMAQPLVLARGTVVIGASIGIAISVAGDTPDSLLARADTAMYRSKRRRPSRRGSGQQRRHDQGADGAGNRVAH